MPQGPDLSKSIRTMKKDIDRARQGGPNEDYIPPVAPPIAPKGTPQTDLTDTKTDNKPAGSFAGVPKKGAVNDQADQMQKIAEDKARIEKLRIEEQEKKEAAEKARILEEEKKRKIEEQKKEEEKQRRLAEEKRKQEEEDRKKRELEKKEIEKREKEKLREAVLKEDLSERRRHISEERKKLDLKKNAINFQLKEIAGLKKPMEEEKSRYVKKLDYLKESHRQLSAKEDSAEKEKRLIEEKESTASDSVERQKLEKERWRIEEKRRDVEKKRWLAEESIRALEAEIQKFDLKYWPIKEKEESFKSQADDLKRSEEDLKKKIEEVELREDFKKAGETKSLIEKKIGQFEAKIKEISQKLETALGNEKYLEEEEKSIEEKEKAASDFKERKEIEEKRWLIEKQRRSVEQERWNLESQKKDADFDLENARKIYAGVSAKFESMFGELSKSVPVPAKPAEEKKIPAKPIEIKKEPEIIVKKIETDALKEEIVLPGPKPVSNGNLENNKKEGNAEAIEKARQKIEELKKKDIIEEKAGIEITSPIKNYDLKQQPAVSQYQSRPVEIEPVPQKPQSWEQIQSQLKSQPKPVVEQKAAFVPPAKPMPARPQVSSATSGILASHPLPKRSGLGKKVFARILTITLLAALIFLNLTFWYWYIFVRVRNVPTVIVNVSPTPKPECLKNEDCLPQKICSQSGKCEDKPIVILGPIFPIAEEKKYRILDNSDIPGVVLSAISEWPNEAGFGENKFRRIIIINDKEGRQATIKEIFDALLITMPNGFYERLGDNYTFFEYSQKEGVRIGLASSTIDSDNLAKLLSQNEGSLKDGLRSFFALTDMESPLSIKTFSSASKVKGYAGPDFRYLGVAKNDLGICYSVYNSYFVLGSSFEITKQALTSIKSIPIASPIISPSISPITTPK